MDKQAVLEKLKEIKYPGFSRDIVSFGMVQDVNLHENSITIQLKITTEKEDKKKAVVDSVRDILASKGKFESINIELTESQQPDSRPQAPPQGEMSEPTHLDGIKHIIAVASGKGGVGKSTVAANLAVAFSQKGFRVGLLDLDIYGPSLPIVLGVNEQPELTQEKKLIPVERFGMNVMSFGLISGNNTPAIWRGPMVSRMTEQFFRDVIWGELDYMILDLPPGTGDIQLTLTQKLRLSGAIIVTTPQDIALSDVRKGADMFRKVQTPVLGVIENMSGLTLRGNIKGGNSEMHIQIEGNENTIAVDDNGRFQFQVDVFKKGGGGKESERLGVPLLGEIPISQNVMEATDAGKPIVLKEPESPISAMYVNIAKQIETALQS